MAEMIVIKATFRDDGQVELRAKPILAALDAKQLRVIAAGLEIAARGSEVDKHG
jgi:hypothetical protein